MYICFNYKDGGDWSGVILEAILECKCQYGSSTLVVGEGYRLRRDRDNPHDSNAVAVVGIAISRKQASLKRDHAGMMAAVFDAGLISRNYAVLKPKSVPIYHSPRIGMTQTCNVAFRINEDNMQTVKTLLTGHGLRVQFA